MSWEYQHQEGKKEHQHKIAQEQDTVKNPNISGLQTENQQNRQNTCNLNNKNRQYMHFEQHIILYTILYMQNIAA